MRSIVLALTPALLLTACGGAPFEAATQTDEAGPSVAVHDPVQGVDAGDRPDAQGGAQEAGSEADPLEDAALVDAGVPDTYTATEAAAPACADGCEQPDGGCALQGWGDGFCGPLGGACSPCPNQLAADGGLPDFVCSTYYQPNGSGPDGTICVVR